MSKSNATETDLLNKIFNNTALPWDGITNLYVSLHTADPTESGNQQSNEAAYTNYARVTVARTNVGWTVSNNTVTNAAVVEFPQCGASGATVTHVAIGTTTTGNAGQILYSGQLTAPLAVSSLISPRFDIGAISISED